MNMLLKEIRSKYKQARALILTETFLRSEKCMSWVTPDKDPGRAKCRICGGKTFDISNMGEAALTSHAKGIKHQSAAASEAKSNPITGFLTTARATATPSSTSLSLAKQSSITDMVTKNEVLTAEVMWALKVANSHYSFKSSEDASLLFQRMFPKNVWSWKFGLKSWKSHGKVMEIHWSKCV